MHGFLGSLRSLANVLLISIRGRYGMGSLPIYPDERDDRTALCTVLNLSDSSVAFLVVVALLICLLQVGESCSGDSAASPSQRQRGMVPCCTKNGRRRSSCHGSHENQRLAWRHGSAATGLPGSSQEN